MDKLGFISFPYSLFRKLCIYSLVCLTFAAYQPGFAQEQVYSPTIELKAGDIPARTRIEAPDHGQFTSRAGGYPTDFKVKYSGFPVDEKVAFQYAVNIWAGELFSKFPIEIEARYQPISSGALASVTPVMVTGVSGGPVSGAAYSVAFANAQIGCDIQPLDADMVIVINSAIPWHTDALTSPGPGEYDLTTVALHQIAHGLGITTVFEFDDGVGADECPLGAPNSGCFNTAQSIYDNFLETGGGLSLTPPSITNNSVFLGSLLQSNNIFWNGVNAFLANSGVKPQISAPATFVVGESISHLDESIYPPGNANSLLTPVLNPVEVIHDLGPILRGMLKDIGWNLTDVGNAYFDAEAVVFAGEVHAFTDRSSQATSWEWDFDNNGSVDATIQNPGHIFPTAGTYTTKLTINGNPALTHLETVEVFDKPVIPYYNDFDAGSGGFYSPSVTCDQWELGVASTASINSLQGSGQIGGSGQSWTTNLNTDHGSNTLYYVESPPIDFVGATGDYFLRFDYLWAAANDAGMNVQYSTDGGNLWNVLGGLDTLDPNADVNWYNIDPIASLGNEPGWQTFPSGTVYGVSYRINLVKGFPDVRFRIKFGAGSNFALDGIQIDNFEIQGNVLGPEIEEPERPVAPETHFAIFPNPASDLLNIEVQEDGMQFGELRIFSSTGQRVWEQRWEFESELHTSLSLAGLSSGVYVVEWFDGKKIRREKAPEKLIGESHLKKLLYLMEPHLGE